MIFAFRYCIEISLKSEIGFPGLVLMKMDSSWFLKETIA